MCTVQYWYVAVVHISRTIFNTPLSVFHISSFPPYLLQYLPNAFQFLSFTFQASYNMLNLFKPHLSCFTSLRSNCLLYLSKHRILFLLSLLFFPLPFQASHSSMSLLSLTFFKFSSILCLAFPDLIFFTLSWKVSHSLLYFSKSLVPCLTSPSLTFLALSFQV